MKKVFTAILALAMTLSLVACGGENDATADGGEESTGEKIVMRVGTIVSETSHGGIALLETLKPYIEETSGGRIEVQLYLNSTLGDLRSQYEAVQLGTLECATGDTATLGNFSDAVTIFDLPYLFTDNEMAYAALDGEFGQMVEDALYDVGLLHIAYNENGWRCISNNVRPVHTPDDMEGLKIRVMESPSYMLTMEAMGANPTPMAFSELYTGLSQGTIDGQDNGVVLTYSSKLQEVLEYFTVCNYIYAPSSTVVNPAWFESLPSDLQEIVREGIVRYSNHERELSRELTDTYLEAMEEEGVEVIFPTDEEKEQWIEIGKSVWPEITKDLDPDLVAAAMALSEGE